MENKNNLSRRHFLRGVSTTLAGVAVAGTVGFAGHSLLSPARAGAAISADFPYKKLNPDVAAEMAYRAYHDHGG